MAERYLITIPTQSKSNWIPPRDLFVVCYFEKSCTAPVPTSLKPEQCRAGRRKLGGFLGKSTRTHSWSDTIPQKEATVRRKQWRSFRSSFWKKEVCESGNKIFSPDHSRFFWNLRSGRGVVRVFPFMPSFLLKSLKTSTQLHVLALDSPGCLYLCGTPRGQEGLSPPQQLRASSTEGSALNAHQCLLEWAALSVHSWLTVARCDQSVSQPGSPPLSSLGHLTTLPDGLGTQEGHVWPCLGEPAGVTGRRDRGL